MSPLNADPGSGRSGLSAERSRLLSNPASTIGVNGVPEARPTIALTPPAEKPCADVRRLAPERHVASGELKLWATL
jgi:hypothetical protein